MANFTLPDRTRNDWRLGVQDDTYLQLCRYRRRLRRRLASFARGGRARTDLLVAFPAAAIELALETRPRQRRVGGLALLDAGGNLRDLSAALEMPYWLRRLPPEVLTENDPRLAAGEACQKLAAQHLPTDAARMGVFLAIVREALAFGDEAFAIWLLRAVRDWSKIDGTTPRGLLPLALFAFFSQHAEGEAAALISRRWHARMGMRGALQAANIWLHELRRQLVMRADREAGTWLAGGRVSGYRFEPLMTPEALREEGNALDHCVACYAEDVARNELRIFSVRQGNRRIATLEIVPHAHQTGMPAIGQFYGPANAPVREEVWRAAFLWLARQQVFKVPRADERRRNPRAPDLARWQAAMAPFWRVHGVCDALPQEPRVDVLARLTADLRVWTQ